MKKIFLLLLIVLMISCEKQIDNQIKMVSIPYYLTTECVTKVSYENSIYSLKETDKLYIKGVNREDITGTLSYNGNLGEGDLYYNEYEGEPSIGEDLSVILIHGDNENIDTYSNKIVKDIPNNYNGTLLQYAVENYSKFTSNIEFGDTYAALRQTSCFIVSTININFTGIGKINEGETSVEVNLAENLSINGTSNLIKIDDLHYISNFIIVMPGNTDISTQSTIDICDRSIHMTNATLLPNKKYTINRTIEFKPELGDPYWSDGTYGGISHEQGVEVVGIVVFVNNYEDVDDSDLAKEARALTEHTLGYGHALVMSLKNAGESIKGASSNAKQGSYSLDYITSPTQILETSNVSGCYNTTTLKDASSNNIAATLAYNYRASDDLENTSKGFLPSIGQGVYSISTRGFGGADPAEDGVVNGSTKKGLTEGSMGNLVLVKNNGSVNEQLLVKSLNDRMQTLKEQFGCEYDSFGIQTSDGYGDNYWSSSEYNDKQSIRMNFGSVETGKDGNYYSSIKINSLNKSSTYAWTTDFIMKVRPFLAF